MFCLFALLLVRVGSFSFLLDVMDVGVKGSRV